MASTPSLPPSVPPKAWGKIEASKIHASSAILTLYTCSVLTGAPPQQGLTSLLAREDLPPPVDLVDQGTS